MALPGHFCVSFEITISARQIIVIAKTYSRNTLTLFIEAFPMFTALILGSVNDLMDRFCSKEIYIYMAQAIAHKVKGALFNSLKAYTVDSSEW